MRFHQGDVRNAISSNVTSGPTSLEVITEQRAERTPPLIINLYLIKIILGALLCVMFTSLVI